MLGDFTPVLAVEETENPSLVMGTAGEQAPEIQETGSRQRQEPATGGGTARRLATLRNGFSRA